jgi:uncharacterized phage protein gp47/JayE
LSSFIAAFQAAIPDVWLGEDGNLRILLEIEAGQIEGLYVANQILLEDMFVQSASYPALQRHGEEFGLPLKVGTPATGQLRFSGDGGTTVPIGTEVAYDPGSGADILYFVTTATGTLPNPGIPTVPTVANAGAGNVVAGTYEYQVTFVTAQGETLPSDPSAAIILGSSSQITVGIPLGGPGTIQRNIYRSVNGGTFFLVGSTANNTSTTFADNNVGVGTQVPPTVSTAEALLLSAQSEENGTDYNAVAGAITTLSATPDGITAVTNPAPFTGGSDPESMDDYRARLLTFIRSPQTGSPSDLITWAEEIDGVDSATVFPNDNLGTAAPGHVTVRISGPNGTIPLQPVIDAVAASLAARDLANITIHVGTFTASPMNVSVTITPSSGFVRADITPNVQEAISDYILSIPVGGTLFVTGIIQHVREVVGVDDVAVTLPASNQTASSTTKFTPGTITVS